MAYEAKVYMSGDTNGPGTLTYNTAGALITVLDACLVNGWNLPTVSSLTRSGTTAILAFSSGHGISDNAHYITISGANQSAYNGSFRMTYQDAFTLTYTMASDPGATATGTIVASISAAGWAKTYSGTNKAVYRAPSGNRMYLRIDDTTITAGNVRARGYETMSDVDTGTGPFPTDAQLSGGFYWSKGSTSGTAWTLVATDRWFLWRVAHGGANFCTFFGEYRSNYYTTDSYNTLITGAISSSISSYPLYTLTNDFTATSTTRYSPRKVQQTGSSVATPFVSFGQGIGLFASSYTATVDPATNDINLYPIYIGNGNGTANDTCAKGLMHMLWQNGVARSAFADKAILDGAGYFSGQKFLILHETNSSYYHTIRISSTEDF